jgi:phenylacetate-CoA ligase
MTTPYDDAQVMTDDPSSSVLFEKPADGVNVNAIAAMMKESQFWSADTIRAYQQSQVEQLLRHAKKHVPFYRERLDAVFRSDGSIDWSRWSEIPIVKRADLRDKAKDMRSPVIPRGHGSIGISRSSGSTGVPIEIINTILLTHVAGVAWSRFMSEHGIKKGQPMVQFKAYLPNGDAMTEDLVFRKQVGGSSPLIYINRNLSAAEKLRYLGEMKQTFLNDTTNHLEVMAHENLRRGKPVSLDHALCIGMKVSAEQEKLVKESFGATTLSPYSSKEGGLMAFQCSRQRSVFHVNHELVLMELLDDNDQPVPVGQKGRVVITPFFNSAQPLIRYEQGDIAIAGVQCSCGRSLPVLAEISGRSDAIFRFPEKYIAMTRFDDSLVQSSLLADAYQFAQVEPRRIVVRYVSPQIAERPACEIVRQHLLSIVQTDVAIEFARVDSIPFNSGGKQQRVTREFS